MPVFPLDQPVRLTFLTYSDAAGTVLADPTTVSVDIETPAGVVTTYTWAASQITRDSLGTFHIDYTPASTGHYTFHWKSTGAVTTSQDGWFDVDPEYQARVLTVSDFATKLGDPGLDRVRAAQIIDDAQRLCETIVKPLPTDADLVVYDVAQRAFANPVNSGSTLGLYAEGEGPYSDVAPGTTGGGLYLTQENKATLRRLAGQGGAFMIDTAPSTAAQNLPWWDTGATVGADWDVPA